MITGFTKIDGEVVSLGPDEVQELARKHDGLVISSSYDVAEDFESY